MEFGTPGPQTGDALETLPEVVMVGKMVGDKFYVDGKEVTREEFDAAFPDVGAPVARRKAGVPCEIKPKLSDALGVHPRQVKEATESARRKGVPTEFAADGRAIIRNRSHQKQYLKAYGFHNKDGCYGD